MTLLCVCLSACLDACLCLAVYLSVCLSGCLLLCLCLSGTLILRRCFFVLSHLDHCNSPLGGVLLIPIYLSVLFSGLQQGGRLVGVGCPRLRNGRWLSAVLRRPTDPDLREDRLWEGRLMDNAIQRTVFDKIQLVLI